MHDIEMPRGDSRTLRFTPKAGERIVMLGDSDSGLFRVHTKAGETVFEKQISPSQQDASGRISVQLLPEDTAGFGESCGWFSPGEPAELLWELELIISGQVVTPVIAGNFRLIIDCITPDSRGG